MKYSLFLSRGAEKTVKQLPPAIHTRIFQVLADLTTNPRPRGSTKLTDREAWRIRVGDYRVIYKILDKELVIVVIKIGHRRDVYRT